jgi:hypothetical protein
MSLRLPPRKINTTPRTVQVPARTAPTRVGLQVPSSARRAEPAGFVSSGGFATARAKNAEFERNRATRSERGFEFGMKAGEGGVNGVTIILTDRVRLPDLPYFQHTHRWGFDQGSPKTEVCLQDGPEGCPLCRSLNKKGGFEMVLSCIDTRPYTPKHGANAGKTVPRSRKPYVVKTTMIPVFERIYNKHKTFRGLVLRLHRDGGKNSPGSGSTVEVIRQLTEQELAKYGAMSVPIDYAKAYPRLTPQQMAEQYQIDAGGRIGGEDFGTMAATDDLPF